MPNAEPFVLILPDSTLKSFEEKSTPIIEATLQPISFLDITKKLIDFALSDITLASRKKLKKFLAYLWDKTLNFNEVEQLRNEYQSLLNDTNIIKAILECIIIAQHKTIQTYKKLNLNQKEKNQNFLLTQTQARLSFLISIKNILEEKLYTVTELESVRSDFLIAIFKEIEIIVKNISHGFYINHFTQNHKKLTNQFEEAMQIAEKVFPKISQKLQPSSIKPDIKALHEILSIIIFFPIYKAKIYFAQGKDEIMLHYLTKDHYLSKGPLFAILQEKGEISAQENYSALCQAIIIAQEELKTTAKYDKKRQAYIDFYNTIKTHFQSDCQLFDIRIEDLKEKINSVSQELALNKATEVTPENINTIKNSITLLCVAQRRNYDLDLDILSLCDKVMTQIHKTVKNINTVITDSIIDNLCIYSIQMNFHKEVIEKLKKEHPSKNQEIKAQEKKTKVEKQLMGARQTIVHYEREIIILKEKLESALKLQEKNSLSIPDKPPVEAFLEAPLKAIEKTNYEKEIRDLEQKNATLELECSKNKDFKIEERKKKKALKEEIETLKKEIQTSKEETTALQSKLETLFQKDTEIIEHLKKRRSYHRSQTRKAERKSNEEIKKLTEKIEALQLQIKHSLTTHKNTQIELEQLKEEREKISCTHRTIYEQWSKDTLGYYNVTTALICNLQSQLGLVHTPTESSLPPPPYVPPIIYNRGATNHNKFPAYPAFKEVANFKPL